MNRIPAAVGVMLLAGCTQAQVTRDAQLFCGIAAAGGPVTVALVDAASPTLEPITVTTRTAVDSACRAAGGIPVAPPQGHVPTVAVVVP
jgi:hypothetical protein